MMVARTGDVLSTFELIGELTLPTDGKCEEDMKELETDDADHEKGHLVRARNLHKKLARRGKRKLMSYQPIKFTVDTVCCRSGFRVGQGGGGGSGIPGYLKKICQNTQNSSKHCILYT